MRDRNTFLAILLCLAILIGWQAVAPSLFPEAFPPPPSGADGGITGDGAAPAGEGASDATERDGGATAKPEKGDGASLDETDVDEEAGAGPPTEAPPSRPEERVVLENERVRVTFSSLGAAVASWVLLDERFVAHDDRGVAVDLVEVDGEDLLPFSTRFDGLSWPADASYEIVERSERSVTFRASAGGVTVEKRFALNPEKPYELSLSIGARGGGRLRPEVLLARSLEEEKERRGPLSFMTKPMPDIVRPTCAYGEEVERRTYDEEEPTFGHSGDLRWVGIDSRYFLEAVYPAEASVAKSAGCTLEIPEQRRLRAVLELPPIEEEGTVTVEAYLGPKFKTQLAAYGHDLDRSIDFGWFGLLSIFLLYVMTFFEGLFGNWGVAIILLTVTVKTVLLPLTNWSMRSMERMRAISPKMKALKEKYGKDQQRFQQEMMKLYREEGVSPFGGCLPMLLQFPIWIALYRTILNTAELYHAGFVAGWLEDLSAPEPGLVKVLPLLMGVTMFIMQRMQPTPAAADETQAKMQKTMMYFMPPFFTFIMYGLPSGLTLYIFVNNVLSIGQQQIIRKRLGTDTIDESPTKPEKTPAKAKKKKAKGKA